MTLFTSFITILSFFVIGLTAAYEFPGRLSITESDKLAKSCGRWPPVADLKSSFSTPVNRSEAPWAVRLTECSATLISKRHILTAAHCLEPTLVNKASFGFLYSPLEQNISYFEWGCSKSVNGLEHIQERTAVEVFISEKYYSYLDGIPYFENDIAILLLEEDIKLTENIYPACLSGRTAKHASEFKLYGYGNNTENNNTDNVEYTDCLQTINIAVDTELYSTEISDLVTFKPASETPLSMARSGDSGAGIISDLNDVAEVYAVLSAVGGNNMKNALAVRVSAHFQWILAVTGIKLYNHETDYYSSYGLIVKQRNSAMSSEIYRTYAQSPVEFT